MRLKVLAPAKIIVDTEVEKVVAKSPDGYFCLLEHHIDYASELAPGVLSFRSEDGNDESLAVDEGILVKCGGEVLIATRDAVADEGAEKMTAERAGDLLTIDEEEKKSRRVLAGLEAEFTETLVKK